MDRTRRSAGQTSEPAAEASGAGAQQTRVMGLETEYGISALQPGRPLSPAEEDLHPMQLSNHVVKAYGHAVAGQPAGWDYETETPLRDIRGYEM